MEIAKKGKWRLRVRNEAINKIWRSKKKRNRVKELEMLHRGIDWLWVVAEGKENLDYTQIKTANQRVTYHAKGRVTCYVEEFVYTASQIANII